ncbi:glycosyltransferase family 4 protein [Flavobacterium sp. ASV13]|uniref:glycosyltransferase family 4 protein n=1 Tax=Flavobacterium sp. ASV13 TaxID=1506583 RepID=UPI00055619AB|nr:glycosyltransferase family 4 protein [Flavobacterium sp. ASV13]
MKVLWIVNTIFPGPSEVLGLKAPVFGGWMYGLANQVGNVPGIELSIATIYGGNDLKKISIDEIHYYLLPSKSHIKYDKNLESVWLQVCNQAEPDVVHIHGTEFTHGLACMRILPDLKYIVSIQGLVGIYSRYYYAGLSFTEIFKNISFRDIVRFDTIFQQKNKFSKRGKLEQDYLLNTNHVIGRTNWDYVHTKTISKNVDYHFCNESLRNAFYGAEKWSLNTCTPYSLFLSQAGYPIKGLHQVIKALAILKADFPNLRIRVGGGNITEYHSFKDKIKLSGYGKYIRKLLKTNKLEESVVFLGNLSEQQMVLEYQKAHIFICPSSIENSPNSLGEAQLLGTPVIASYVGGVPDMVEENETGILYRFEEVEMLANNIRNIFNDRSLAQKLSIKGIEASSFRHDREINLKRTIEIYKNIALQ